MFAVLGRIKESVFFEFTPLYSIPVNLLNSGDVLVWIHAAKSRIQFDCINITFNLEAASSISQEFLISPALTTWFSSI